MQLILYARFGIAELLRSQVGALVGRPATQCRFASQLGLEAVFVSARIRVL